MSVLRRYISEVMHGAGADYLKKETIKDELQHCLESRITSGEIVDQASLNEFFATVDMAAKAIKMIPFDVWRAKANAGAAPLPASKPKRRRVE